MTPRKGHALGEPAAQSIQPPFPAHVVEVLDAHRVLINVGFTHGVRLGQTFIIYCTELKEGPSPDARIELGDDETLKGQGEVIGMEENMSVLLSAGTPFHDVRVGDRAKPL